MKDFEDKEMVRVGPGFRWGPVYSRLHKGGTFIIGSRRRRVATKKARRNRASKGKEKNSAPPLSQC